MLLNSEEFLDPEGILKATLPKLLKPGTAVDVRLGIRIFVRNSPSKQYTGSEGIKILKFDFEEFSTRVAAGDWEMKRDMAVKLAALHFQTVFPGQTDFINPASLPYVIYLLIVFLWPNSLFLRPDSLVLYMGEPWRSSRNIIQLICDEFGTLTCTPLFLAPT